MTDLAKRQTATSRVDTTRPTSHSDATSSLDALLSHYRDNHPVSWDPLLEALPDGTALLDDAGVMHYVNQRLAHVTGYTREELVSQNVMMLVPARLRNLEHTARVEHSQNLSLIHISEPTRQA